jgi:CubicO group peptidase (beta-lactamase class C family)
VLRWDTPLEAMLPDLAATMQPAYRSVTLLQLLSHKAGLPHDPDEKLLTPFFDDKRPAARQRLDWVALALKDAPVNKPGTAFSYSNSGFLIAAAVAERATGKSYETLMHDEVFAPLGMRSPGFGVTHAGQPMGHVNGKVATLKDGNPEFFAPAGNVYLSLDDWAVFCLDQMAGVDGHGRLLKPATYRLMQTAPVGLGWGVSATDFGRQGPVLTHAGSDGTWLAFVALFPAQHSGLLAVANASPEMGADKALRTVVKTLAPALAPPAPAPAAPAKP